MKYNSIRNKTIVCSAVQYSYLYIKTSSLTDGQDRRLDPFSSNIIPHVHDTPMCIQSNVGREKRMLSADLFRRIEEETNAYQYT